MIDLPPLKPLFLCSILAFGALAGCDQQPDAENAQSSSGISPADQAAIADLARVGTAVAAQSADLKLEFLGAKNGVDPAQAAAGESWSLFHLSFAAAQPSQLQLSGNLNSQMLSPENQARQERWQKVVCTPELGHVMRAHQIDLVYATFGKADMPIAQCQ
ncbi:MULTISPECIES: hypothetical protein [unclassified Pseudomonas]|uniref:hypothetical protein n=1 Tax=unclassified Pseudomonas TaxID=196821 RepID=UPI0024488654|nr:MULTISPECIES: hypothetical protein [unclassified Pseudomonas]MDG9926350.1 hypothetical protein [Pseudomonas sp. GD04045]MDH0037599.1 hypothetical protein [Pseudomonas sp. GD04019]